MSRFAIPEQFRVMRAEIDDLRRRLASVVMTGVVKEAKGDKVRIELLPAEEGGEPFLSPLVGLGSASGAKGGGHSVYTKPGVGEPMLLISPGGEIGPRSVAYPSAPSGERPAPGAAERDGYVHEVGSTKFELSDGRARVTVGAASILIEDGVVTIAADAVRITGTTLTHNGRDIGDTHRHTDVTPGPALTGPPA